MGKGERGVSRDQRSEIVVNGIFASDAQVEHCAAKELTEAATDISGYVRPAATQRQSTVAERIVRRDRLMTGNLCQRMPIVRCACAELLQGRR
jgi:hypothetical protein